MMEESDIICCLCDNIGYWISNIPLVTLRAFQCFFFLASEVGISRLALETLVCLGDLVSIFKQIMRY